MAVYARLMNINRRFQALRGLIRAGSLAHPRVRRPEEAARRQARRAERAAMDKPPAPRELPLAYGPMAPLPRDFGYVLRLVPWHAAPLAHQMRLLLAGPEMAEIIAATPRLQRLLPPLCHMLGIETAGLIPPPPPPLSAAVSEAGDPPEGPVPPPAGAAGEGLANIVPSARGADIADPRVAGPPGGVALTPA